MFTQRRLDSMLEESQDQTVSIANIDITLTSTNTKLDNILNAVNNKSLNLWRQTVTVSGDGVTQNLERGWVSNEWASVRNTSGSTVYVKKMDWYCRQDLNSPLNMANFLVYNGTIQFDLRTASSIDMTSSNTSYGSFTSTYNLLFRHNGKIISHGDYNDHSYVHIECIFDTPIPVTNNSYIGFRSLAAGTLAAGTGSHLACYFTGYY